jgi:hypothetical protein
VKVAFQKHDSTFFAGLIRWWTKSPYSHCELLFDDGLMFSSHVAQGGTRFWTPGILSANTWDIYLLPTTLEEDIQIRAFCGAELGCGYDWKGILFSQFIRLQREHPSKWFCSEICAAALQRIDRVMGSKPCTFSPGKLHKRLKEAGGVICAQ